MTEDQMESFVKLAEHVLSKHIVTEEELLMLSNELDGMMEDKQSTGEICQRLV